MFSLCRIHKGGKNGEIKRLGKSNYLIRSYSYEHFIKLRIKYGNKKRTKAPKNYKYFKLLICKFGNKI